MNKHNNIVVRFAPSPTGAPHLGNIRTALINYIFAKKYNGNFLLRIEDTDKERSQDIYVDKILESLTDLGIKYDTLNIDENSDSKFGLNSNKNIIFQSQRKEKYLKIASDLVKNNIAYKEHNENGTFAIKLKVIHDNRTLSFEDSIRGKIEKNINEINDLVLIKSDGFPAYMFAVVVDDNDMKVNHIVRGDDHLVNTFKQNLIYKALNFKIPNYTHLPMILSPGGKKLSKRNDSVNLEDYLKNGFLSEALINYLLALGWSYERGQREQNKEISEYFSLQEAIDLFDIQHLRKSPSKFDKIKLLDINFHYIQKIDIIKTLESFIIKYRNEDIYIIDKLKNLQKKDQILYEVQKRSKTLIDLIDGIKTFILFEKNEQDQIVNKFSKDIIKSYIDLIKNQTIWSSSSLMTLTRNFCKDNKVKMKDLMEYIRATIFNTKISPSIFVIMEFCGKDKFLSFFIK